MHGLHPSKVKVHRGTVLNVLCNITLTHFCFSKLRMTLNIFKYNEGINE